MMSSGIRVDSSGLGRTGKRAALLRMQDGRCACCHAAVRLHVDHDHDTGMLRGLLCPSDNNREGRSRSRLTGVSYADIDAYLADPPAAGLNWMWDIPDWWKPSDDREVYAQGITVA